MGNITVYVDMYGLIQKQSYSDGVALAAFELSVPENLKYSHAMAVGDHKLSKQEVENRR